MMSRIVIYASATLIIAAIAAAAGHWLWRRISLRLRWHFAGSLSNLEIVQRKFPFYGRLDVERTLTAWLAKGRFKLLSGVNLSHYAEEGIETLLRDTRGILVPQYDELEIGLPEMVRCLRSGLWIGRREKVPVAVLLALAHTGPSISGVLVQVATPAGPAGTALAKALLAELDAAVHEAPTYRGQVLAFVVEDGVPESLAVQPLRHVPRENVILLRETLDVLDRNVIRFADYRRRLAAIGQPLKKGLMFYGPPGTGKTHTIHYLLGALEGHTTLLITAEHVQFFADYMVLARALTPSVVVIEDADLIARTRTGEDGDVCEPLLNKLLNELDGFREDTETFFILTTNRPETIEPALASRPGRIDQAVEFPLPNEAGRARLARLYARDVALDDDLLDLIVERTARMSAAFIRELMRRAIQIHFETAETLELNFDDVDAALDELIVRGGSLNMTLLGAGRQSISEVFAGERAKVRAR